MRDFRDSVAVVTGAASGIGRALAHRLADMGARIAISDVDENGLEQTRAAVAQKGAEVQAWRLDVADRKAVFEHADAVVERFGRVHLVINNAGVTIAGTVKDTSIEDFEWLMGINFWGVVYGTKAFLPHLERSAWGHIVNVSSVFGIIAVPRQSSYNASKFAVRGFTEALRQELDAEGSHISCTSVHPGGIKTNIARAAKTVGADPWGGKRSPDKAASDFEKMARTTPDEAARIILDAARRNKKRVLVGPDAHLIDMIQRSMPTSYQKLVAKAVKPRGKRR
ncbi:MAG: SDR family oxidoreductase [Myxococcota bacterium]